MTDTKINQKTRCSHCGRVSVLNMKCTFCNASESQASDLTIQSPKALSIPNISPTTTFTNSITQRKNVPSIGRVKHHTSSYMGSEIRGRVIIAQQAPQEPMDFDPWRWIAFPVWGGILLMSPVILGIVIWKTSGLLVSLLIAFITILTLRYIFSNRLIQSWHLAAAFNGRRIVESMPVLMIRLRTSNNRELQMRIKGVLSGGTLMEGDRILARGEWSNGSFKPRSIYCERTHATITPHQPSALIIAISGFAVLSIASLWLYYGGIPWASNQIHQFQESVKKSYSMNQPHDVNL